MTEKIQYSDFPLDDCVAKANQIIADYPGTRIYQKFSCGGCGARLTIDVPNEFHSKGTCDQCNWVTDIRKQGCNYLVVYAAGVSPTHVITGKIKEKK